MKLHPLALSVNQLYAHCDPRQFSFDNTASLTTTRQSIGQERALDAIHFGVDIQKHGYNLYLLGPLGIGKHTLVQEVLQQLPPRDETLMDYCYVNNFEHVHQPISIRLPAGLGIKLKQDLLSLTKTLAHVIPKAFKADSYDRQVLGITSKYRTEEESAFNELDKQAKHQKKADNLR